MATNTRPEKRPHPTIRPRLAVTDAAAALRWYQQVLGAEELARYTDGDRVVHAELTLGGAVWTLKDADDVDPAPAASDGSPVLLMLAVEDVDAVAGRMAAEGAVVIFPVDDHGYGRMGRLRDPFGHVWMLTGAGPP